MNSRQFVTVVIITFIVGMIWLIADILFNTKASIEVNQELQSSLEPVNPNFNTRVLDMIGEVSESAPAPSIIPIPTQTTILEQSTPSAIQQ